MTITLVSAASEQPGKRPGMSFLLSSLPGWRRLVTSAIGKVRPDRVTLPARSGWAVRTDSSGKPYRAERNPVDRDGRVSHLRRSQAYTERRASQLVKAYRHKVDSLASRMLGAGLDSRIGNRGDSSVGCLVTCLDSRISVPSVRDANNKRTSPNVNFGRP